MESKERIGRKERTQIDKDTMRKDQKQKEEKNVRVSEREAIKSEKEKIRKRQLHED